MSTLTAEQLRDGYHKSVENAFELLETALALVHTRPHLALGLAEIGQEELGKSLTCLSAIALPSDDASFRWFWTGWRNHELKAHRACLYALINPMRFAVVGPDGVDQLSVFRRGSVPLEKEAAFYVDYDRKARRFVCPAEAVLPYEPHHRLLALVYLSVTAFHMAAALEEDDAEFRHRVFGALAFTICSSDIYQQDMPGIFASIAAESPRHRSAVAALDASLTRGSAFIRNLGSSPSPKSTGT